MQPGRVEPIVMRQDWNDLLFVHWPVPEPSLRPLVPEPLEIDTFDGQAYVGLVPFAMRGVRPVWSPPIPGVSNFLEVNVRTYVRHPDGGPGVWFFSLDADSSLAVRVARRFWRLPYHRARMSLRRDPGSGVVDYRSTRLWPGPTPAGCSIRYRPVGSASPAETETLEHFLVERYVLYSRNRMRLDRGRVHHHPYPLQAAELLDLDDSLVDVAGIDRPDSAPLVHYARGVSVRIEPLRRIPLHFEPLPAAGNP